jgi:hypothetical protein
VILHSSSFVILSIHFTFIILLKHLFTHVCNLLVIWLVVVVSQYEDKRSSWVTWLWAGCILVRHPDDGSRSDPKKIAVYITIRQTYFVGTNLSFK